MTIIVTSKILLFWRVIIVTITFNPIHLQSLQDPEPETSYPSWSELYPSVAAYLFRVM